MIIKEGHEVCFEGETYTVLKIYGDLGLMQSAVLLRSMDGKKLLMTAVNLLKRTLQRKD